ncbi:ATP-binding protein [Acuticoccus sp. MNP-M23]|uniref:ATP-binding protein n=1 Tax=Acuticoccus sp. MNP-M23 TaxID=3072793 RepID=UPI002816250E|nr:ATP-binding protein [Acuticoccus sp. MNP-M23]WMS42787.1 ATP-binding protein [Acuticoccus sp. MNP-M23]
MALSLSRFFERTENVSLSDCDLEQVHLCGTIQQGTGMIVLVEDDSLICGASENIDAFFGLSATEILGTPLNSLSPEIAARVADLDRSNQVAHEILDTQIESSSAVYDIVTHTHAGHRFIEFIRSDTASPAVLRKRLRSCGSACSKIMGAESFAIASHLAATAVQELTEIDRVKIFKFLPDWSGSVIAEARTGRLPSMAGMHFPDTDIPKQVRDLMTIIPYRFIGTASDENVALQALAEHASVLDMTWSISRAVSTMHTAYLRNMGAETSFSCNLINNGQLWGLIACHHSEMLAVPPDSWSLAQEISTALMLRYDQTQRTETANMITQLRRIESEFAAELRQTGNIENVVVTLVPVLRNFLRADGFAFLFGQNLYTSGETPPDSFIRDLMRWINENTSGKDQFQTISLQNEYPAAAEYKDVACGVLAQPIVVHRVCQLLWFRGPITRRIAWAGRPDAKVIADPETGLTLGPRQSFDRWIAEHRDQSLPWKEAELQAAREIFQEFLDIVSSQLLLRDENASLRRFAHMAAHDIKSPLRGITSALTWMEEDKGDEDSIREHRELAALQARKLQRLTESLLEMSVLREQAPTFEPVNLATLVADACELMKQDIRLADASITTGTLPVCNCAPDLLVRIFLNLIGNALKYAKSDSPLRLKVEAEETDSHHLIVVTDNGPGIPDIYAERIFEPSKRLVHDCDAEGSGFGLSICAEIAKLHGGRIFLDTSCNDGAKFVLELPKSAQ